MTSATKDGPGGLGAVMTVVVVDGPKGKEYRLPTDHERAATEVTEEQLQALYADIPFGLPEEQTPKAGAGASRAFSVDGYGIDTWRKLFTNRQLATQRALIKAIAEARLEIDEIHDPGVADAIVSFLASIMDRQADYGSTGCIWVNSNEHMGHQFSRFALPIVWDIAEVCPFTTASGGLMSAYDWVTRVVDHLRTATSDAPAPSVELESALGEPNGLYDAIITDPPYYDAIPYSDLMDFFYIWLRRVAHCVSNGLQPAFVSQLGPKWDAVANDGELVDDASRFDGDRELSRRNYEDGMARAFRTCLGSLKPDGRLVVAFASKSPAAWETIVRGPDTGGIRRGRLVAHPDGAADATTVREFRRLVILDLDRLQKACARPSRLGRGRSRRDAGKDHPAAPRLLGRGDSRAGLRLGGDRPCAGGLQQAPGRQEGERPGPVDDGIGVPARGAADGSRFRRRERADP